MNNYVTHRPETERFEMTKDGYTAYVEYDLSGDQLDILHTIVPGPIQGDGVGSALVKSVFEYAEENDLQVIPTCYFSQVWLKRHPQYKRLVE